MQKPYTHLNDLENEYKMNRKNGKQIENITKKIIIPLNASELD
jgi:hypothetical protein